MSSIELRTEHRRKLLRLRLRLRLWLSLCLRLRVLLLLLLLQLQLERRAKDIGRGRIIIHCRGNELRVIRAEYLAVLGLVSVEKRPSCEAGGRSVENLMKVE